MNKTKKSKKYIMDQVDQSIVLVFQPLRLSVKPEKLWVKVRYNSIRHLNVISELALLRNEGGE